MIEDNLPNVAERLTCSGPPQAEVVGCRANAADGVGRWWALR